MLPAYKIEQKIELIFLSPLNLLLVAPIFLIGRALLSSLQNYCVFYF